MQCYKGAVEVGAIVNKAFTFAAVSRRALLLHLLAIVVVVGLGAGLDVMEVDAAQYAGMSRDMAVSGDVLEIHYRDRDYLDKPPLLFWLSSLSFKVFGVHDRSYRLPSILFAFLGLYAVHRFTLLHHAREVAVSAMLMYGCSVAFFLMCNDVRCDTMLTGAVMTAIWLGCAWLESGRWTHLIGFALAIAAGMLAKGPIGAVAPAFAIGGQIVLTRGWRRLRDPRLLVVPALVALALLPMCIGLYQQHGWHGVRFYFWEQSFGRITGENRWKDDSTVLFFTHELLWQLLPWTLFVLIGIWKSIRALIRRKALPEYASLAGAVLTFTALSFSQFKLPHYLYVALPLFAVMAARELHANDHRWVRRGQSLVLLLFWSALLVMAWCVFPETRWPFVGIVIAAGIAAVFRYRQAGGRRGPFEASFWLMVAVGLVLNGQFYPNLLAYQANAKVGQWAAAKGLDREHLFGLQVSGGALDYYAGYPVSWLSNAEEARAVVAPGVAIYTDALRRQELLEAGLVPRNELHIKGFPAQRLSVPFLMPASRAGVLEEWFVLLY